MSNIVIRSYKAADADVCADVAYRAFCSISRKHNFPDDFQSLEHAGQLFHGYCNQPGIVGFVAEADGKIVASNFLDERDPVRGVGPMTVDPDCQGHGLGRRLMQAVIDQGKGAVSIRLVQDAFNTVSMSLYTSLGFDAVEPLALVMGRPKDPVPAGYEVRPLTASDLPAASVLCKQIHTHDRSVEVERAILAGFGPVGAFKDGKLVAYGTCPFFWAINHGVGKTEADLQALILGLARVHPGPISFLQPIRRADMFRWVLSQGLRVVKPMTLMSLRNYIEPASAFYPAVAY